MTQRRISPNPSKSMLYKSNLLTSTQSHGIAWILSIVLITEHLLSALTTGHTVLFLLTELGRCELGLLLGALDLVAHGIELIFLVSFLRETGTSALTLDPVVTGRSLCLS